MEPESPGTPRDVPASRNGQRSDMSTRKSGKVKIIHTKSEDEDTLAPTRRRRTNRKRDVSTTSDNGSQEIVPLPKSSINGTRSGGHRYSMRDKQKRKQLVSLPSHLLEPFLDGGTGTAPLPS